MRPRALSPVYQMSAAQVLLAGVAVAVTSAVQALFYVAWWS